tara:strand:+ start:75 stop:1163 length:1089 start_codon:yes stop_codon:yes gene_type:complete
MYEITIYPNTIAPWFAQVYAGMYNLKKNGEVRISISTEPKYPILMDGTSLAIDVYDKESDIKKSILIDLNDNRGFAVPEVVDWFDVIVKRSYLPSRLDELPKYAKEKVIPYGINFNCGSSQIPILNVFLSHHLTRARSFKIGGEKRHSIRAQHQLRFLFYIFRNNLSLNEEDFLCSPYNSTKYGVFFLTRMYEYRGGREVFRERDRIYGERIKLVSTLMREFGSRFFGGIVDSDISRKYCPKDLLCKKLSRREFVSTLKNSDISINTLGAGMSNPWKLGESMAAARCIVSEPLEYKLPVDLKDGENFKLFRSIDDCVSSCQDLLSKPSLVAEIKQNNFDYYNKYIKSDAIVRNMLKDCFEKK